MSLHERYGLTPVINAAGTYTPLGVSRSPELVQKRVAQALGEFFVIDELEDLVSRALAGYSGAESGAVCHCVAAGLSLSVAATMSGVDAERIAALPDTTGMANGVVIPAGHCVDYGHPITTAVRLAGARPVIVGSEAGCEIGELEQALAQPDTACLLIVASRLVRGAPIDLAAAVAAAHRAGVPAIVDGAAQDRQISKLVATGADLVLVSAHKYLASPTAGVVVGTAPLVAAVRAQGRGIGRAMKPTKEALVGVLAALEARAAEPDVEWQRVQRAKIDRFVAGIADLPGVVDVSLLPDAGGMPVDRVRLQLDDTQQRDAAAAVCAALAGDRPSIRMMTHELGQARLVFELVPLRAVEIDTIIERLGIVLTRMFADTGGSVSAGSPH
ncbi:aminotransferase class V-fold PLP-dependent enzyme [Salinisphaera sp. T31B1]|uniref:aminotransferase class V-fold PLP-dependent enzyme n=1 Tax=Salinisphaera sp. T31B1 TaxID=727963 RepID=UPI0033417AC2